MGNIDDMEYARSFIESRKDKKSRKELYAALSQKGVEKELTSRPLRNVMEMRIPGRQSRRILQKKSMIRVRQTMRKPRKILGYLVRKGFHYEDIRQGYKFLRVECLTSL